MAGRRRRGEGVPPKPKIRVLRSERRMNELNRRLVVAGSARERVAVAADYFRGALTLHPDVDAAERMVILLIDAANDVFKRGADGDHTE